MKSKRHKKYLKQYLDFPIILSWGTIINTGPEIDVSFAINWDTRKEIVLKGFV